MNLSASIVAKEALCLLSGSLNFGESKRPDVFLGLNIRSALVEAVGAWRADQIMPPVKTTITIRKPPRYRGTQ